MGLRKRLKQVVKVVKKIAPIAQMAGITIPGVGGALALASKLKSSPASALLKGLSRSRATRSLPVSTDSLPDLGAEIPPEPRGRQMRQPRGSAGSRFFVQRSRRQIGRRSRSYRR